ncbi:MAG: hypothetical protein KBH99_10800, partial [Syntrophobacteraceae bacterium]|nr:hypothetical protein [Syntrophobacteraceae bacterium]
PHEHLLAKAGTLSSWNPVPKRMYHTTECFQALLSVYLLRILVYTTSADEALSERHFCRIFLRLVELRIPG